MRINEALEAWLDVREAELQTRNADAQAAAEKKAATAQEAAATFAAMFDQLDQENPAPAPAAADHPTADDLMAAIRKDSNE